MIEVTNWTDFVAVGLGAICVLVVLFALIKELFDL